VKIITVLGARPQFIKAALVSRAIAQRENLLEKIVHTGQHYDPDLSDVFFRELELPRPAYRLEVGSAPHGAQTGRMLEAIENVLTKEVPDWVVVYGDTNSTLAGALAASKLGIAIAHIEAGLRSFNGRMPEEINRRLTDHLSHRLFVPTLAAEENLRREGVGASLIRRVGDVTFEGARHFGAVADRKSDVLNRWQLSPKAYAVATVHRAENTDDPQRLLSILEGLHAFAGSLPVIFPLHPRTRRRIAESGWQSRSDRFRFVEPLGYLDMLKLQKNAGLIATDSGGVQKEAYFFRVPCVTLREETEWTELIQSGGNRLVRSFDASAISSALCESLGRPVPASGEEKGDAVQKIVDALSEGP